MDVEETLIAACTSQRVELFAGVTKAISMWEKEEDAIVGVCVQRKIFKSGIIVQVIL